MKTDPLSTPPSPGESVESELAQARRFERFGRLAGSVAHDFNNLLTMILGNAQLLMAELDPRHPARSRAAEIAEAASSAAALIGQLFRLSRGEPNAPATHISRQIEAMEPMLLRLVGPKIRLEVMPRAHGLVAPDVIQLSQILLNLVVNSRDAMPDGGTLLIETSDVEVEPEAASRIDLPRAPGSYVTLTVSDSGVGIEPEGLDRIFEPFYSTKGPDHGTGLGLATVSSIVKRHHGYVAVDSSPGEGTTMRVFLPRLIAEPAPVGSRPALAGR